MSTNSNVTCEPGRTIYIDGAPAFYVNLVRNSETGDSYLAPYQVDSIARQLAEAMKAGFIRAPQSVNDAHKLDKHPPAEQLLAALEDLRKELRAHVKLDIKKHYSLMAADAAAGTAIHNVKGG